MYKKSTLMLSLLLSAPLAANPVSNMLNSTKELAKSCTQTALDATRNSYQGVVNASLSAKDYVVNSMVATAINNKFGTANEWVKDNPYYSIGIATVAGAILTAAVIRKLYNKRTERIAKKTTRRRHNRRRHNAVQPNIVAATK